METCVILTNVTKVQGEVFTAGLAVVYAMPPQYQNHQAKKNTHCASGREWQTVCPDKDIVHQATLFPLQLLIHSKKKSSYRWAHSNIPQLLLTSSGSRCKAHLADRSKDLCWRVAVSAVKLCVLVWNRLLMREGVSLPHSITTTATALRLQEDTSEWEGGVKWGEEA